MPQERLDVFARMTFGVEVHAATREENIEKAISNEDIRMNRYNIPWRALIARNVNGAMTTGRCISGDLLAHANTVAVFLFASPLELFSLSGVHRRHGFH